MTAPLDLAAMARELMTVKLDGRPEGTTVREAMYFDILAALQKVHDAATEQAHEAIASRVEAHANGMAVLRSLEATYGARALHAEARDIRARKGGGRE